jgi:Rho GTPase-activating protein RGD1
MSVADDGYSSSAWETNDLSTSGHSMYGTVGVVAHDPATAYLNAKSSSPQPRSSADSSGDRQPSKWSESAPALDRRDAMSNAPSDAASLVETTFDENILRALCDLDVSPNCQNFTQSQ